MAAGLGGLAVAIVILSLLAGCRSGDAPVEVADVGASPGGDVVTAAEVEQGGASDASGAPAARREVRTSRREVVAEPPSKPAPADPHLRLVEHSGVLGGPIEYQVVEPDDATPTTPVIIALHGMGDTPDGFTRFVRSLKLRARVLVARGSLPFGNMGGRQWYENDADDAIKQVRQRAAELAELGKVVRERYPEAGKPALIGFSQGAAIVLQAALETPDDWRAVVGLSGFIPSETGAKTPTTVVPILVVAGTQDSIVPAERSWFAAGALKKYGHTDVRKLEFDGPHQIPRDVREAVRAFFVEVLSIP